MWNIIDRLRRWSHRRTFREGEVLSRFIARDIRRDVQIVSVANIDEGIIIARIRTTNVLYRINKLATQPEFGPASEVRIDKLWDWTGEDWGGLPDGTSLVARTLSDTAQNDRGSLQQDSTDSTGPPVA
ncbi:MAG TPA: hypothetical protein VGQ36_25890 [Thermoanaerobaculia bacterium]|jgi:hypothetical protein|nr:hypothetical protein [Thermoanaerobaculia bacterium]